MSGKHLSTVNKVLKLQLLVIVLVSVFFAVVDNRQAAFQVILGGMAAFIPNLYFALRIQAAQGLSAKKIVRSFYTGESGKLLLTAAMFIVIFQLPDIKLLPLMTGYVSVLSIFWFALILRE